MALALLCSACAPQAGNDGQNGSGGNEPPLSAEGDAAQPEQPENKPDPSPAPTPLPEDGAESETAPEQAIREFGEAASYVHTGDDLVVHIVYPTGGPEALGAAVETWVQTMTSVCQAEAAGGSAAGHSAELTVDYSSYQVDETLVSVRMSGVFNRPSLPQPTDVAATFNADLKSGRLLKLTDVLHPGGAEQLRTLVAEQVGLDPATTADDLLNNWVLTHDGLEFTLVRGDYLPMKDGSTTVVLPYSELEDIYAGVSALPDPPAATEQKPASPPAPVERVHTGGVIALTFDDGPSAHTDRLLDLFATHGGKGTFFVVGNMVDNNPAALARMVAEGHQVGGHSWNHRRLPDLTDAEITEQLAWTRDKILEASGADSIIARPPYGASSKRVRAVAEQQGISLINWSVDTLDWQTRNADAVYRSIMAQVQDGAIILCHDLHKSTVDAMERVIPDLIGYGYQLVTVSELLTSNGEPLVPGKLYSQR